MAPTLALIFGTSSPLMRASLFSIEVSIAATALAAMVAVPIAYVLRRRTFGGKSAIDALLTLPLVLPPTVIGYALLVLLGRHGWVGRWVSRGFGGYTMLFAPPAAILAASIVGMPLLYLPAKAAFAGIDRDLEDVARLLGVGRWGKFWHVCLPLARRGLAAGLLLAFARALGEFGATMMVLGDQNRWRTLPILIFDNSEGIDYQRAAPAVWGLSIASLLIVLIYNRLPLSRQE